MAHCIRAFLGHSKNITLLSEYVSANQIQLPQGLSMIFLTDSLFDKITEAFNTHDSITVDGFIFLTSAVVSVLEKHSQHDKLAYFETDYFGGKGTQSAALYEGGKQTLPPIFTDEMNIKLPNDKKAINVILKQFGIRKSIGKDEFESIGLDLFRKME